MKERNSNIELLRIVAMMMIVFYHFFIHTWVLNSSTGSLNTISHIIVAILVIHVNLFILIFGYFGYKSKFKVSKLLSLNNAAWFYKVLFTIIAIVLIGKTFTKIEILKAFSPIPLNEYWFITTYILLYLISPLLNKFINNSSRKTHLSIIVILLIIFSVLPTITAGEFFDVAHGFSLYHFINIYLIGAYLGKYKIQIKAKYLILAAIILCVLNITNFYIGYKFIYHYSPTISYIGNVLCDSFLTYSNPIIIFQSIAVFLLFTKLKIQSKVINKIATCVFGVYLIHDNSLVREFYSNFFKHTNSLSVLLVGIAFTIIVFVTCVLFEALRKQVFKFIYNLKICKKIRPKYTKYFNKIEKALNG